MSKNIFIEGEDLMKLVKEQLGNGQVVRYLPFSGRSMLPMLREGKDSVELSPLPDRLRKYDLPVYQCRNGKYVMHRVVAVRDDCYICNGDNLLQMEKIYPDQLVAIVSAFTRNGKRIEVSSLGYRIYCRFWCAVRPIRHFIKRVHSVLALVKKRIVSFVKRA